MMSILRSSISKIGTNPKARAEQAKQTDASTASQDIPKLIYSNGVFRNGKEYIYAFRSVQDMGDRNKPEKSRAFATISVESTEFFTKVVTGPRVMEQIIRSNNGKLSREQVVEKLSGSLLAPV